MDSEQFRRLVELYMNLSDAELQRAFDCGPTGYEPPIVWELVSGLYHQRSIVRAAEEIPIRYSDGSGSSLDDPIVVSGAGRDLLGTLGIFAWLIQRNGTMDVDWTIRRKSGHHEGERHIDIYTIQDKSGELRTFYVAISESYLKPNR